MKRPVSTSIIALLAVLALSGLFASGAVASFGFSELDLSYEEEDGSPVTAAGKHPYAITNSIELNTIPDPVQGEVPDEQLKDLQIQLPPGLVGNPTAMPRCSSEDFATIVAKTSSCPDSAAVGVGDVKFALPFEVPQVITVPVYNLIPAPGTVEKLGFVALGEPVTIDLTVNPHPPYNVIASLTNIAQPVRIFGGRVSVWGNPASPVHDNDRGLCAGVKEGCHVALAEKPFLAMPVSCTGPLPGSFKADSWQHPGSWLEIPALSPNGLGGCPGLGFSPHISATTTTDSASSPSGLDFGIGVEDEGLTSASGTAQADIKKAVVTLPEGVTANPSLAEGLQTCSEAQFEAEEVNTEAGEGCPQASRVGDVEVETPLLEGVLLHGQVYIASQGDNPFGSLLALYMVIREPQLGVLVKLPGKVETDPNTGQLTTTFGEAPYGIPQFPFSHFRFHFREGARAPLATPPACGTYTAQALLYPSSGNAPLHSASSFQITSGPGGGPCPTGGLPPFKPGLIAGTVNNAAGRFSPFNIRLSRNDTEQEITHFSVKLPPGVVAKLAGVPFCPDAAIAAAKARTGFHGGAEEIAAPSCPAASEIGHTLAGSGVGQVLAYAPGKLYLAGPYHGSALSVAAITAAKVGPFDLGTVVVREALKIDPETAEVSIDATGSDPIPHIIRGIAVHLRDIRAYTDRPSFTLNPTDCTPTSTASTLLGAGLDFASEADDRPVTVSTPFQAADCAALPFKPRLALSLRGGTKRGQNPAFKAVLGMNGIGEAGIQQAQVTLPKSEFIDNAHFNTICTRVQFKQGAVPGEKCPAGSVYGHVTATTPILADPLEGPIYLRSSEHQLPDVVAALHNGQIDIVLDGRVDSVKGRLRTTFEATPDAPVGTVVFQLLGGKKGLFENSTNLCAHTHKAIAAFTGQNGKEHEFGPVLKAQCSKGRGGKGKKPRAENHNRGVGR